MNDETLDKSDSRLPELLRRLRDVNFRVSWEAALAFDNAAISPCDSVPLLMATLRESPLAHVRASAARALCGIGWQARAASLALAHALGDESADVRRLSAEALESIGPAAYLAQEHLEQSLADTDLLVRISAAAALRRLGSRRRSLESLRASLLRDVDLDSNDWEKLAELAEAVFPLLVDDLDSPEARVRCEAARALQRARSIPPGHEDRTIRLLRRNALMGWQSDPDVADTIDWNSAADALAHFSRQLPERIEPILCEILDAFPVAGLDRLIRLSRLGLPVSDEDRVRYLVDGVRDPDNCANRCWAAEQLGHMGPKAQPAVPDLIWALRNDLQGEDGDCVITSLGLIGPASAEAVPAFIDLLHSHGVERHHRFYLLMRALGLIGRGARDAIPVLREFTIHPDPQVRSAATAALTRVSMG